MTALTLRVTAAEPGGWTAAWRLDGQMAGPPVPVPADSARSLAVSAGAFDGLFDRSDGQGHVVRPLVPADALRVLGQQLFDVWCQPIWDGIAPRLAGSRQFILESDERGVLNLPWELLPLGLNGGPVGCDPAWALYRTPLEKPAAEDGALPPGPLRLLFVAAAPEDQKQLDYEKEQEALLRATAELRGAVIHVADMGSLAELKELVQQVRPHIVHLSGHGKVKDGHGTFCFEDEEGHSDARPAGELVQDVFRGSAVRCVFLNGCETSQAAVAGLCQELVRAGLPLAVGWAASVADDRATAFAETFYRQLLAGEPAPAALAHARLRIQRDGFHAKALQGQDVQDATFVLPQLYCATPAGELYDRTRTEEYRGPKTEYVLLPGGVEGLQEGFVGRRREQQRLIPALRRGEITVAILTGVGGQGKSTLATRVATLLAGSGFRLVAVKSQRGENETAEECARRTTRAVFDELRTAFAKMDRKDLVKRLSDPDYSEEDRLRMAVDDLNELAIVFVLDNFEDVLDLGTRAIQDPALAAFYQRLMTHLTRGSRVLLTSRYLPAGTPENARLVRVCDTLHDFQEADFLKFLRRDPDVERRMRNGQLPEDILTKMFRSVGGTPRFLGVLRSTLKKYDAQKLSDELSATAGMIEEEREKYLQQIFGPKLYDALPPEAQRVVIRLALSELPLPADAVGQIAELDEKQTRAALGRAVAYGLLQEFTANEKPTLYLPPGLLRPWLSREERLPEAKRTRVHAALAAFWKGAYEQDRERELRVSVPAELEVCRHHAREAGDREVFRWGMLLLSRLLSDHAEWRSARRLLEEVPEPERDGAIWHNLASLDLNEGSYAAARDKFAKALAINQQIGRRAGEAATWHQLATLDVHEGLYAAARDKFATSLTIKQEIGDRAGEAATWHNLASLDLEAGSYAAARDKFAKALAMRQQIGDPAGEAAIWHQLATLDDREGSYAAARDKLAKALAMRQQVGDRAGEAATWHALASLDLKEGSYAAARDKFAKSLAINQQIGGRAGEAATWAQLATLDLKEGSYAAARDKFAKSLAMNQQIGDRAGEAATFHQLGMLATKMGNLAAGARLVAVCFLIDQSIGHGDAQSDLKTLSQMCARLGYDEQQIKSLLQEVADAYQQDRGRGLIHQAFAEAESPPSEEPES